MQDKAQANDLLATKQFNLETMPVPSRHIIVMAIILPVTICQMVMSGVLDLLCSNYVSGAAMRSILRMI